MIKVLRQVWTDISQGENLDLYVLVFVALGLTILDVIGRAPQSLETFTIAILAILAISLLGNRHRLDEILQGRDQLFVSDLSATQNMEIGTKMSDASDLLIMGTTLSRTIESRYDLLERKLQRGESIRIVLVEPNGDAAKMAAWRKYHKLEANDWSRDVSSTLKILTDLRDKTASINTLEIRTIDFHIAHGGIFIDPNKPDGLLFLSYYSFKTRKGTRPKFILRPADDFYSHFVEESNAIWKEAKPWDGSIS